MEIPPALLQFVGSLAAILVLVAIAWRLRLGPERKLASEDDAREAAREVSDGFMPVAVAVDRQGRGALLRDRDGRVMLLRPHGSHIAGRILGPRASGRVEGDELVVETAERRFGPHRLAVDDARAWVEAIEALKEPNHA